MIIPVRCYSCGKMVADKWRAFQERTNNGEAPPAAAAKALDDLGLTRYCCKRMLLAHVDLVERL